MTDLAAISALADRFFAAIEADDVEAAADCYAAQAVIWHNTDGLETTREENMATLRNFIRFVPSRRYEDRRVQAFPGGFVQQHRLTGTLANGKAVEMTACIVCAVSQGKITRLDEYFDSATLAAWTK